MIWIKYVMTLGNSVEWIHIAQRDVMSKAVAPKGMKS